MAVVDRRVGKWRIIKTSAWDRAHLDLVGPAFIVVDANGHGEMAFGAFEASLNCGFTPNGIDFEWNGVDEVIKSAAKDGLTCATTVSSKAKSHTTTATKPLSSPRHGRLFQQPVNLQYTAEPSRGPFAFLGSWRGMALKCSAGEI